MSAQRSLAKPMISSEGSIQDELGYSDTMETLTALSGHKQ